jgi:lipoprotein-anchoring transpeptidase ErfK/SrfK
MRRLLVTLSGLYAIAVVAFCTAGVFHDRPEWADATKSAAIEVRDTVVAWTEDSADAVNETVVAWFDEPEASPPLRGTHDAPAAQPQPTVVATPRQKPIEQPAEPTVPTQVAQAPQPVFVPAAPPAPVAEPKPAPQVQVAEAAPQPQLPAPRPEIRERKMSPNVVTRVRDRLRASLTDDLYNNFDLFLYVSKADHGPWSQQMFVFAKDSDSLRLVHNWPVSTGREQDEPDAHGRTRDTSTPAGYYQLDPNRMLRKYRSVQWDAPMPHSMFFNWIRGGSLTGLAIHGVEGQEIALLGTRASAGCVRLSPQSAQTLFEFIQKNYRGEVPRFAMGTRRYSTMSTQGDLMRRNGDLVFERGYRVLVYIDSYGGQELVSALY